MYIGTSVTSLYLDDSQYLNITAEEFNFATVEWELKWKHVEPEQGVYTYELADKAIAFIDKYKMGMRGHTLVWYLEVPDWVYNLNKTELQQAIDKRIR